MPKINSTEDLLGRVYIEKQKVVRVYHETQCEIAAIIAQGN